MQCAEGEIGRVFAIRLEHGEPMPESLERLAADRGVRCGLVLMIGGADDGSRLVVGPEDGGILPPVPLLSVLCGVHEVTAVGTLFPDETGKPVLHMHGAFGRGNHGLCGCIREGIVTWQVLEIVLVELVKLEAIRARDPQTGLPLLQCCEHSARGWSSLSSCNRIEPGGDVSRREDVNGRRCT